MKCNLLANGKNEFMKSVDLHYMRVNLSRKQEQEDVFGDSTFYSCKSHIYTMTNTCFPYTVSSSLILISSYLILSSFFFTSWDKTGGLHGSASIKF